MTLSRLVFLYTLFAVAATVANLAAQRVSLAVHDGAYAIFVAVIIGTGVGLVLKYILDKRYIFADCSTGIGAHSRLFGLYTAMGIVTTVIFWGTELAFWSIWQTHAMRELGAVIGLAIGYVTKYQLDKRFVFASLSDRRARA